MKYLNHIKNKIISVISILSLSCPLYAGAFHGYKVFWCTGTTCKYTYQIASVNISKDSVNIGFKYVGQALSMPFFPIHGRITDTASYDDCTVHDVIDDVVSGKYIHHMLNRCTNYIIYDYGDTVNTDNSNNSLLLMKCPDTTVTYDGTKARCGN